MHWRCRSPKPRRRAPKWPCCCRTGIERPGSSLSGPKARTGGTFKAQIISLYTKDDISVHPNSTSLMALCTHLLPFIMECQRCCDASSVSPSEGMNGQAPEDPFLDV